MRKVTQTGSFITTFDPLFGEVFFGVSTGFDFCTEHESGIRSLQIAAGITSLKDLKPKKSWFGLKTIDPPFGLDRTTIRNTDGILQGIAETDEGVNYYLFGFNVKSSQVPTSFEDDFEAYWDDSSFLIASTDKDKMTLLVIAAYNQELAFTTGGKVLEDHAGLRIVIKSNCPIPIKDQCMKDDIEIYNGRMLEKKLNLKKKLDKAECGYFACSLYWKDYDNGEYHYWLNPRDQNNHNSGYFTYEELIEWTKGKGPVIKTDEQKNSGAVTEELKY